MQLLDAHDANEVGATSNDLSANEPAHLFRVARGTCAAALLTVSQFATFEYVFRAGSVKGTMGWTHRAHGSSPTVDPSSGVSASHPIPPSPPPRVSPVSTPMQAERQTAEAKPTCFLVLGKEVR